MSVMSILQSKRSTLGETDPNWVQYVKDFRDVIIRNSTVHAVDPDFLNQVRYDVEAYLRSIPDGNPELAWVVRYINTFPTDVDFTNVETVYVPDYRFMHQLYQEYLATQQSS